MVSRGARSSISAHAQSIGDTVDIIEPRGDKRDLQNAAIVKTRSAKLVVIFRPDLSCILSELYDVIEHYSILFRDRSSAVILFECLDHGFIESDATQKLCVRFDSIVTPVRNRHDRRDHLMLAARER
jgi:hypothetical protein